MNYKARISVFGGREITKKIYNKTYNLGKLLNANKYLVYCGGGEGVMEAIAKGVNKNKGICIGILKGATLSEMNKYINRILVIYKQPHNSFLITNR